MGHPGRWSRYHRRPRSAGRKPSHSTMLSTMGCRGSSSSSSCVPVASTRALMQVTPPSSTSALRARRRSHVSAARGHVRERHRHAVERRLPRGALRRPVHRRPHRDELGEGRRARRLPRAHAARQGGPRAPRRRHRAAQRHRRDQLHMLSRSRKVYIKVHITHTQPAPLASLRSSPQRRDRALSHGLGIWRR